MTRTKKRPYTKSKRFDKTCRNHGSCPYCEGNRTHNSAVQGQKASIFEELCSSCGGYLEPDGTCGVCDKENK